MPMLDIVSECSVVRAHCRVLFISLTLSESHANHIPAAEWVGLNVDQRENG